MSDYSIEEENVQALKQFWEKNHKWIMSLAIVLCLGYASVAYFMHHKQVKKDAAAAAFLQMLIQDDKHDGVAIKTTGEEIVAAHSNSAYSVLTRFLLAKYAIEEAQYEQAFAHYDAILQSKYSYWHPQAHLYAAQLYVATKNFDKAAVHAAKVPGTAMDTLFYECQGDIAFAQNDTEKATQAYKKALDSAVASGLNHPLLVLKLQDLGIYVQGVNRG